MTSERAQDQQAEGHQPADPLADRFRQMLVLIQLLGREATVESRMRRMVESSVVLGRATFAAFARRNADSSVQEFVFSSSDAADLQAMQQILSLYGIAGSEHLPLALVDPADGGRRRVRRSSQQRRNDLLDIPVRTESGLYGNLYVMLRTNGSGFTDEDRELLTHFTESSAVGMDNAAQLEEAWHQQHWLVASAEISRRLLGGVEDERQTWRSIADVVAFLASARTVTICLPDEDDPEDLQVQVAAGVGAEELTGRTHAGRDTLAHLAITTGEPQIISAGDVPCIHTEVSTGEPIGHIVSLPLKGMESTRGAITLSRDASQPLFGEGDIAMAEAFANQAALALELAEARSAQQTLEAREDRERIAESLQDKVIQRLFSIGLSLQSTASNDVSAHGRERVTRAIDDIDETIRQVRASIDPLISGRPATSMMPLLRTAVTAAADEFEPLLGFRPEIYFAGALDTAPDPALAEDIAAVLGEALANVAQHSSATRVRIDLIGTENGISVIMTDDGFGFGQRSTGLAKLWDRASARGRTLNFEHPVEGGLRLRWFLPYA